MKRTLVLALFTGVFCTLFAQAPYSQRMTESLSLQSFTNNKKTSSLNEADFSYVPGLVAKSVLVTYRQYPEKEAYWEAVKAYADRQLTGDAQTPIKVPDNDIDAINAGKIFFDLYTVSMQKGDVASAEKYRQAATYMYHKLKTVHTRIPKKMKGAGCFIHKGKYPYQMWLDGLYMGAAFLAGYEATFNHGGKAADWSDIALQFKTIHRYTWDKDKQLNYHAWSANPADENSFWANDNKPFPGCSKEFWARGEGWYFAALTDVLEVMPKHHKDYKKLLKNYREVAAGLARWQHESGSWFQLLQYDENTMADGIGDLASNGKRYNVGTKPNYLEASASGMFTYAFLKGIRLGLLDRDTYLPIAEKAWAGLLFNFITENPDGSVNIIQTCASAGLGPAKDLSRTGTINYYLCGKDTGITQNEGKAIGSFSLAACEWELLQKQVSEK